MNRKKRNRRRLALVLFLLLLLGAALSLRYRYLPFLQEAARTRVINAASDRINDAINAQIESGAVNYENIVCLEKNTRGEVTAVRTNMAQVNRLKAETLALLSEQLLELDTEELSIPLGSIVMPGFFAGKGLRIPVRVTALSTTDADFYSEFSSAGINQTLQRILLEVKICMSVQTPMGTERADVASQIVVAETIIVGSVPQSYFQLGQMPDTAEKG